MEDRAYEIAINLKYDEHQRGLASMVCKFFDKKKNREWFKWRASSRFTQTSHNHRRKFYARIKDDIWVADLAKMESLIEVLSNYCVW